MKIALAMQLLKSDLMKIVLAILLGSYVGFALAYVGATVFNNILKMLRLEDLTLAKVILFAIGLSSVLLSFFGMIDLFNISHFHVKSMNLGVILGGVIFGFAFGWLGTCPGTCIGAIGSNNIRRAISVILGGLLGAFTYSMIYGFLNEKGLFKISEKYPSIFDREFSGLMAVGLVFMGVAYIIPIRIKR